MIFRFGEIIFIFLRSIFLYKFNKKEKFPELYYSGYCLFKDSFRYPSRSKSDFLILFKIFKNIIISLFFKNVKFLNFKIKNGVAIIDGSLNSSKMRTDHVRKFSGLKTELVISKDHLLSYYSFSSSVIIRSKI